jgi:hypothetical protein
MLDPQTEIWGVKPCQSGISEFSFFRGLPKGRYSKDFNLINELGGKDERVLTFLAMGSVVTLILLFCGSPIHCAIPHMVNYQGMLTDDLGDPPSGPHNLTFRIYDDTTGGNLEWSESQNGVQVEDGLFNVILGRMTPLNLAFDEQYWLEVQVDSDTMPRLRFTSVGYAYRAKIADSATVAVSAPTGGGWTDDGTVVRLATSTDSVGIGTTSPNSKLHVNGSLAMAYKYVTDDYTCTDSDCIIAANATSGILSVRLPSAVDIAGRIYTVKKTDNSGFEVFVNGSGSEKIDGVGVVMLDGQWDYRTVVSDGSNWLIIGENP